MTAVVKTEQGKIKGSLSKNHNNKEFYTFRGIPFAKPPVGELRFAIPEPPEPWEGVRDGTKICNTCAQFDKETNSVVGDEDCLFLNVYTPQLPVNGSSSIPVMVFFHGGGFVFGNATDSTKHGPDYLIEKDVVLVTPNYRVGILGFLALDDKEAPGNMGLRDQVMALKWVQKNIVNFGGDPNNVTIFGISAGGASVEYLLLSPMAKGLFHKAIAQSGSSLLKWAQNSSSHVTQIALRISALKGKNITENKALLQYLKELPISDLIKLSMAALQAETFKGGINFGFVPVVEKPTNWEPFLSKSSYKSLASGDFTKVPFMTGICSREGLLVVSHGKAILDDLVKEKNFVDHFPFDLDDVEKCTVEDQLKAIYLESEYISNDADDFAVDFFTDADFLGGVYTAAMLIAKHNYPVFFYEFAYDGALNYLKKKYAINRQGACHGDDGGYILKCNSLTDPLSETDKFVQNLILDMWTNFAKYSDPNNQKDENSTKWEPIAETGPACFVIDKKPFMKYEIYPKRTKLYEDLYKKKFGNELK